MLRLFKISKQVLALDLIILSLENKNINFSISVKSLTFLSIVETFSYNRPIISRYSLHFNNACNSVPIYYL